MIAQPIKTLELHYPMIRFLIRTDSLCPASQWKCLKSDIRSLVFNNDIYIHYDCEIQMKKAS